MSIRTDCQVTQESLPIPYKQLPVGNKGSAGPGDIVTWGDGGMPLGRVIGVVRASDIQGPHLCVVAMMDDGMTCERWVAVSDLRSCHPCPESRLQWLFGPAFRSTPQDARRGSFDLTTDELMDLASSEG